MLYIFLASTTKAEQQKIQIGESVFESLLFSSRPISIDPSLRKQVVIISNHIVTSDNNL